MGVELLIHTFDHSKALSGFVQAVKDDALLAVSPWSRKETLPNYAIIRLTDARLADVGRYTNTWKNSIVGTPVSATAGFRRFDLSVPNRTTAEFGIDKGISDEVVDFLTSRRGSNQISIVPDRSSAVFDIPQASFRETLDDLVDLFEERVSPRRFQIAPRDVSAAITGGGLFTSTFAPVDGRLIDRQA